jgi:hypothetical protein
MLRGRDSRLGARDLRDQRKYSRWRRSAASDPERRDFSAAHLCHDATLVFRDDPLDPARADAVGAAAGSRVDRSPAPLRGRRFRAGSARRGSAGPGAVARRGACKRSDVQGLSPGFRPLPRGSAPPGNGWRLYAGVGAFLSSAREVFALRANEQRIVELRVARGASVSGSVTDAEGHVVEGALVSVRRHRGSVRGTV